MGNLAPRSFLEVGAYDSNPLKLTLVTEFNKVDFLCKQSKLNSVTQPSLIAARHGSSCTTSKIHGVKFYCMDLVNDVRTTKIMNDPRNASALGRSKLQCYFFAVCGPKFNKLSVPGRGGDCSLQRRFLFDDIMFHSGDIRDRVGSCPTF